MGNQNIRCLMEKILILEGGFNEEHEISLSTAKEIKKSLTKLNIQFDSLLVNFPEKVKGLKPRVPLGKYLVDRIKFSASWLLFT